MKTAELRRQPTGKTIPCPGEAHSNAFIDHCGLCMPAWGVIPELAPVDLNEARTKKLAVPFGELTDAQQDEVDADLQAGKARIVSVTRKVGRKSSTSYMVAQYL